LLKIAGSSNGPQVGSKLKEDDVYLLEILSECKAQIQHLVTVSDSDLRKEILSQANLMTNC
jgi:hypothetical protein